MKITLHMGGARIPARLDGPEDRHVVVPEFTCPLCGERTARVHGNGGHIAGHDEYQATAHCSICLGQIGELRVKVETIFGLEEDHAVLNGRARVYR